MHEMQTIVTDVRGVCLSVSLSRGSTVCGALVQPLPNYFGLLLNSETRPTFPLACEAIQAQTKRLM